MYVFLSHVQLKMLGGTYVTGFVVACEARLFIICAFGDLLLSKENQQPCVNVVHKYILSTSAFGNYNGAQNLICLSLCDYFLGKSLFSLQ